MTSLISSRAVKRYAAFLPLILLAVSCVPPITLRSPNTNVPQGYVVNLHETDTTVQQDANSPITTDTTNTATMSWRTFYGDSNLVALIDSALKRNQELNIVLQEIEISQQEVQTRKGEFLPDIEVHAGAGIDKVGTYTRSGAVEENLDIAEGTRFPTPLPDLAVGATVSWEVDIWSKLRSATKAASLRYLATIEGTNFLVTNIVGEIAASYYELEALDNLLDAVNANIEIQKKALHIIEQQKQAAQATELAVKRFEAEVFKNESRRFELQQRIIELENRINFLVGRFPQHVERSSQSFLTTTPDTMHTGLPPQLLANRPDIHQAELNMQAAELDITVAKARFYPQLNITAGGGYQAFNPRYFITSPESMIYNLAGDLMVPIINRKAIEAAYYSASARQVQSVYEYERAILNAYIEVSNKLAKITNMQNSFERKSQQVEALRQSVDIAGSLFTSARADYMEVLLTQRDALEARMDLIETKVEQMHAYVNLYKALGGGWR